MIFKNYCTIVCTLLLVLMLSCKNKNKNDEIEEPIALPGFFSLTEVRTYKGVNNVRDNFKLQNKASSYHLGSIKSSKEFYFLLTNGGGRPIFDIELSIDREDVVLSPQKMDILPSNSNITYTGSTSFIPLLAIGVIHGTALEGLSLIHI